MLIQPQNGGPRRCPRAREAFQPGRQTHWGRVRDISSRIPREAPWDVLPRARARSVRRCDEGRCLNGYDGCGRCWGIDVLPLGSHANLRGRVNAAFEGLRQATGLEGAEIDSPRDAARQWDVQMEAERQMSAEASAGQQGMSVAPMRDVGICPPLRGPRHGPVRTDDQPGRVGRCPPG